MEMGISGFWELCESTRHCTILNSDYLQIVSCLSSPKAPAHTYKLHGPVCDVSGYIVEIYVSLGLPLLGTGTELL